MLPDNGPEILHVIPIGDDNDVISMTDVVFLTYMSEGIVHSGTLAIVFEYSCSHCSINYLDVQYGDPQMRKHVEGNPNVLPNLIHI